MSFLELEEIIDFAIEEELGAEKLYLNAAEMAKKENVKLFLKETAAVEKEHAEKLSSLKNSNFMILEKPDLRNLKIGENLPQVELTEDSELVDIITFAIKQEIKAHEQYKNLSMLFPDEEIKKIFDSLANSELKHKNDLEKLYEDEFL